MTRHAVMKYQIELRSRFVSNRDLGMAETTADAARRAEQAVGAFFLPWTHLGAVGEKPVDTLPERIDEPWQAYYREGLPGEKLLAVYPVWVEVTP